MSKVVESSDRFEENSSALQKFSSHYKRTSFEEFLVPENKYSGWRRILRRYYYDVTLKAFVKVKPQE